jgi:toxin ParE1/3/4
VTHEVVFSPEAAGDLDAIFDHLAPRAGARVAGHFVGAIIGACRGLASFPHRGTLRQDLRAGLRVIGFRKRASILIVVEDRRVTVLRILYGGRDLRTAIATE